MQLWTASGFTSIFVRHLWDSSGSHVTLWCAQKKKMSKMSSVFSFFFTPFAFRPFWLFPHLLVRIPRFRDSFVRTYCPSIRGIFFFPFRDFFVCFILYPIIFVFSYFVIRFPQVYHFLLTFFPEIFSYLFFFVDIFILNICLINATCSTIFFAFHLFSIFLSFLSSEHFFWLYLFWYFSCCILVLLVDHFSPFLNFFLSASIPLSSLFLYHSVSFYFYFLTIFLLLTIFFTDSFSRV